MNIKTRILLGIRNVLLRNWRPMFQWGVGLSRWVSIQSKLAGYEKKAHVKPLTPEQRAALDEIWAGCPVNYRRIQYFDAIRNDGEEFDPRYLPLDFAQVVVDMMLNDTKDSWTLSDKNLLDLLCYDVKRPRAVIRLLDGKFFDEDYLPISEEQAVDKCVQAGAVICKPSAESGGGRGISFWEKSNGVVYLKQIFKDLPTSICQEIIQQHESFAEIHPAGVNTMRIMTYYDGEKSEVVSSFLKMGVGNARMDHCVAGGCYCGIDENCRLRKYGFDKNLDRCAAHPEGVVFEGREVVGCKQSQELSVKLSYRFSRIAKLISWDWAVGVDGEPILVEMNLCNGGLHAPQFANGPLFGDKTKDVVAAVMQDKTFSKMAKRFCK